MHMMPEEHYPSVSSHSPYSTNHQVSGDKIETTEDGGEKKPARKLFACPYSKYTPSGSEGEQLCFESGWTTITRLRQHIYRCHVLPIKCPSCSQNFESSSLFLRHINAVSRCDPSLYGADEPIKGLESLLQKIQLTKNTTSNPSEEDMWKVLYTTLFPNIPKNEIPNPYHEGDQERQNALSPRESVASIQGRGFVPLCNRLEPQQSVNSLRGVRETADTNSIPSQPNSPVGQHSQDSSHEEADEGARHYESPKLSCPTQTSLQSDGDANNESLDDSSRDEATNMHQFGQDLEDPQQVEPSRMRRLSNVLREKTLEAQVAAFRAFKKPHRTDEHISPGVYRGFWKWLARCLTFYIPSWFLQNFLKMNDARRRLAFRQKVLFCLLVAAVYGFLCYFLVIQPIASCVVKVHIGMISNHSPFCNVVRHITYVYLGLGAGFTLLVFFCAARIRYTNRAFKENDSLLVMHMPCYNEGEAVLRKTIESCVESSYDKKRKLLFIVADGTVAAAGQKPTYKILLEDIFEHSADVEVGIDNQAHSYPSFDAEGASDNLAFCCTGYYRDVPYVVMVKVGRDDERDKPKPGNRGKRDSQLLVYNFFHYVNYRRFWNPLFENLEFKMRVCLNIDPRDATYMLVVDCDTQVERTGISYLVDQLEKDPKLIGVCGNTGVNNPTGSFVACSQVFEYWLTHAVLKAVESVCSNVLVLSGCFTIYRLKWPNHQPAILHPLILEDYAGIYNKTLHEHNLLSIGEDRYLSTLAIRYFGSDCRLQYFSAAKCTTTVPDNLSVLLDQRRRWTNSLIHCHFSHLNVLPFEASVTAQLKLIFVIGCELFMVFILPLALPAGVVLAVISVLLTNYAWIILLIFCILPVAICVVCNDWGYIPFYLPFFPMIAVFSIIIPLFSMWKQDNVKWGKTRDG